MIASLFAALVGCARGLRFAATEPLVLRCPAGRKAVALALAPG